MVKIVRAGLLSSLLLAAPELALAHAVLLHSTPAAHATVHGSAVQIRLAFNSRIDASRSSLSLATEHGAPMPLAILPASPANELDAHAAGLRRGGYTLRWQVLATDGHITRGEIPFRVE